MLNRLTRYLTFFRSILVHASLTFAFVVPAALAQVTPVKFVAAPTVARGSLTNGSGVSSPLYGASKAFVARFNRNGPLDVVFSGVTPSNCPNVYNYAET